MLTYSLWHFIDGRRLTLTHTYTLMAVLCLCDGQLLDPQCKPVQDQSCIWVEFATLVPINGSTATSQSQPQVHTHTYTHHMAEMGTRAPP